MRSYRCSTILSSFKDKQINTFYSIEFTSKMQSRPLKSELSSLLENEKFGLDEVTSSIDVDVYRSLGRKEFLLNPDIVWEGDNFFDSSYFDSLERAVLATGEAQPFDGPDLEFFAKRHIVQLANLSQRNHSLISSDSSDGKSSYLKQRGVGFFKRHPVLSNMGGYILGSALLATASLAAITGLHYTNQTDYHVSNLVERAIRWKRDIGDGESFFLWEQSEPIKKIFGATRAVDEYLLNVGVCDFLGDNLPYLGAAAIIAGGLGYIRGRTKRKINEAQWKYDLSSSDRELCREKFIEDLKTPGVVHERAESYRGWNSS